MKRSLCFLLTLSLFLGFAGMVSADRYLIVYKGKIPGKAAADVEAAGGTLVRTLPKIKVAVAESDDPKFAKKMKGATKVTQVGPVGFNTVPELFPEMSEADGPTASDDLYEAYQWGTRRVGADMAWNQGVTGSHATVVAILDTGIADNHPDLYNNVVYMYCYNSLGSYDDGVCNPYPWGSDHGTHVAGTVAAEFGGGRVVGVGPNLGLAGYNIFELDPDYGLITWSDVRWEAMIDAANRGYQVINMSLGGVGGFGGGNSSGLAALRAAEKRVANYMKKKGVVVVAAAGNDGYNTNGWIIHLPGDVSGYINVGATGIRPDWVFPQEGFYDVRAFYSNYGAALTLAAPGGDIGPDGTVWPFPAAYYLVMSTGVAYDATGCSLTWDCPPEYYWGGGTSQAAPHVSGAAGLVIDNSPWLSPNQVKSILKSTAQDLGNRQQFGHGMVDVYSAVNK